MTIREFVFKFEPMFINEWIEIINNHNLSKHEQTILECADYFNRIKINHKASFVKSLKIKK